VGKGARCVRLTTFPLFCAVVVKTGTFNFLETSGQLGPVMGLIFTIYSYSRTYLYYCFTFEILNPSNNCVSALIESAIRMICHIHAHKKVKCTVVQALRLCTGRTAHRGSRGIAVLYRH